MENGEGVLVENGVSKKYEWRDGEIVRQLE